MEHIGELRQSVLRHKEIFWIINFLVPTLPYVPEEATKGPFSEQQAVFKDGLMPMSYKGSIEVLQGEERSPLIKRTI